MNAYELADELENKDRLWNVDENLMLNTCAMLRQQADRIAELEKDLHMLQRHYDQLDHDTQGNYELILMDEHDVVVRMPIEEWQSIIESPQIKELSNEEILQQAEWMFGTHFFEMIDDQYWIEFAKAILKKASEK
jgi:hypothetical protein